jgi:hypothetical protein
MPHVGPQSPEYLRGLFRALGVSEQTIDRAIQYREGYGEAATQIKPGRGRPRQNVRIVDRPVPTRSVKRRAAKRKRA